MSGNYLSDLGKSISYRIKDRGVISPLGSTHHSAGGHAVMRSRPASLRMIQRDEQQYQLTAAR